MSIRTVILSLVVALALGGASWYLLIRKEAPTGQGAFQAGSLVLDLDPATVKSVGISSPGGDTQIIQRSTTSGVWNVIVNAGKPTERSWPLQTTNVQSLLRQLAEARTIALPSKEDTDAGIGSDCTVVRITLDNGGTTTLRFSSRPLGGRCLVEIEKADGASTGAPAGASSSGTKPVLVVVDNSLYKVFRSPGPRAWRETAAIPGIGGDISRIRLENHDRVLVLGRISGKWALIEPVAVAVDQEMVRKLIAGLSELSIVDFLDDGAPPDDTSGISSPVARIVIETDRNFIDERLGSGSGISQVATTTNELLVGKPSDDSPKRRYAAFSKDGSTVVKITVQVLTQEVFDAARYISHRAIETAIGDIGGVVMTPTELQAAPAVPIATPPSPSPQDPSAPVAPSAAAPPVTQPATAIPTGAGTGPVFPAHVYRRSLDKWVELAGGKETPLDDESAKRVSELLGFFSGEAARSVELVQPPGWNELGTMQLLSLDGRPIGTLTIGSASEGGLVAKTDDAAGRPIYRLYAPGRSPQLLSSLAASLKAATPTDAKPAGPNDPIKDDVMK